MMCNDVNMKADFLNETIVLRYYFINVLTTSILTSIDMPPAAKDYKL